MERKPETDVVVITALPIERDAMMRRLVSPDRVITKARLFYRGRIPQRNGSELSVILLPLFGMGNVSATAAATQAIDVWNPHLILLTGIAGGVKKTVKGDLGDVIVAEQIIGYERGKVRPEGTERRWQPFLPDYDLLNKAKEFSRQEWWKTIDVERPQQDHERVPRVHFGVVGSGEKVIADPSFVEELRNAWPGLVAVEMEGFGVALAAYQAETTPKLLLIKAISDWADASKNDDWQLYAADAAAAFTCGFLASQPFPTGVARAQAARIQVYHFTGRHKIRLCQRLADDWKDLADYFDIPDYDQNRFSKGRECQGIWEWLNNRQKLDGLPDGLTFINRGDLVDVLGDPTPP